MKHIHGMKSGKLYAAESAGFILLLTAWCLAVGLSGFTSWHTIRDLLVSGLVLFVGECLTGEPLHGRLWRGSFVVLLLWMATFPPIAVASEEGWSVNFGGISCYYLAAMYWGIFTTLLFYLGRRYTWLRLPLAGLYGLATFYSILVAFVYAGYYFIFHTAFVADDMIPVVQTNFQETKGFLLLHADVASLAIVGAGLLLCLAGALRLAWYAMDGAPIALVKWKLPVILLACVVLGMQVVHNGGGGFPFAEYRQAKEFIHNIEAAGKAHEKNVAGFHLDTSETLADKLPGTVILVIGESAASQHMSAFWPSHEGETTPWLSAQSEETGFYLFPKSYSNFPQTVQSLGMYLTGVNQYNGKTLADAISILDVAKAAGYKTWWFSNQDKLADNGSPAVMMASWADEERWTTPPWGDDRELLGFLKEVPREGNHFIVLWLVGSHSRYQERYPKDFPKMEIAGHTDVENYYDTSIRYTDRLLSEVFDYARDNLHLRSMAYCSDHGEDMKLGHGAGAFSFDMIRVPLFVYLSDDYRSAYPESAKALSSHKDAIFTNDLMFDTLSGLLQAPSREYESKYDLSHGAYDLPLEKAVSKHGAVKIADDVR